MSPVTSPVNRKHDGSECQGKNKTRPSALGSCSKMGLMSSHRSPPLPPYQVVSTMRRPARADGNAPVRISRDRVKSVAAIGPHSEIQSIFAVPPRAFIPAYRVEVEVSSCPLVRIVISPSFRFGNSIVSRIAGGRDEMPNRMMSAIFRWASACVWSMRLPLNPELNAA